MAHKIIDGNHIVDWITGDPEGDRSHLFSAYRDFLDEIRELGITEVEVIFKKWKVDKLEMDDFPRISIERPADKN